MANIQDYKKILQSIFGMNGSVRDLKDIPMTIGMPEGRYYTDEELKQLYSEFGRFNRDLKEPWNKYYGAPNYIFSAPQWLINKDKGASYHGTSSSIRDVIPNLNGVPAYVLRREIQPY